MLLDLIRLLQIFLKDFQFSIFHLLSMPFIHGMSMMKITWKHSLNFTMLTLKMMLALLCSCEKLNILRTMFTLTWIHTISQLQTIGGESMNFHCVHALIISRRCNNTHILCNRAKSYWIERHGVL